MADLTEEDYEAENICLRCDSLMSIPSGYDPTPYCCGCANTIIEQQAEELAALRARLAAAEELAEAARVAVAIVNGPGSGLMEGVMGSPVVYVAWHDLKRLDSAIAAFRATKE